MPSLHDFTLLYFSFQNRDCFFHLDFVFQNAAEHFPRLQLLFFRFGVFKRKKSRLYFAIVVGGGGVVEESQHFTFLFGEIPLEIAFVRTVDQHFTHTQTSMAEWNKIRWTLFWIEDLWKSPLWYQVKFWTEHKCARSSHRCFFAVLVP